MSHSLQTEPVGRHRAQLGRSFRRRGIHVCAALAVDKHESKLICINESAASRAVTVQC